MVRSRRFVVVGALAMLTGFGAACASLMGVEDAQLDPLSAEGGGASSSGTSGGGGTSGQVNVDPVCVGAKCACNVKADCKDSVYKECVDTQCAECTTEPDSCAAGTYCLPAAASPSGVNECSPGCNSDSACNIITGGFAKYCSLERHQCVQCKTDQDCKMNLNEVCTPAGACARSCPDGGGCGAGQTCCNSTICVDTKTDPFHCGDCNQRCQGATNLCCDSKCKDPLTDTAFCGGCGTNCTTKIQTAAGASCSAGKCNFTTCNAGRANCDGDRTNGCECNCPPECTSCANGVCQIECGVNGCQNGKNCPPGLPCKIKCTGEHACQNTFNCAAGQPCSVECNGATGTCDGANFQKNGATSLCISCNGAGATCSNVTCPQAGNACSKQCGVAGGSSSCNNTCGNCGSVAACPAL